MLIEIGLKMATLELTIEDDQEVIRLITMVIGPVPSYGHGGIMITLKEAIDVINEIANVRRMT